MCTLSLGRHEQPSLVEVVDEEEFVLAVGEKAVVFGECFVVLVVVRNGWSQLVETAAVAIGKKKTDELAEGNFAWNILDLEVDGKGCSGVVADGQSHLCLCL